MIIAHNMMAMNAQRVYGLTTTEKAKTTEKLASGYKINRAADDAAGLTISEKMRSLIRGLNQGSNNIQDGVSLMQIADGALAEVHDMLHRANELAIKSANGTNTDEDRAAIQKEVDQIVDEIDRVAQSTTFNTMQLFDRATIEKQVGTITKLVESPSADSDYMTEAINLGGSWHPSASMDFSGINEENISALNNGYFSFNCTDNCDEKFKITFKTDGTPSSYPSDLTKKELHEYVVDISSCKSGSDVAQAVIGFVGAYPAKTASGATSYGGTTVSHSNEMMADGSKLIVYSNFISRPTEEAAKSVFPRKGYSHNPGYIDKSGIPNDYTPEPKLAFNIQCSNSKDDDILIKTHMMNATYIGVRPLDVSTQGSAIGSIRKIEKAIARISNDRSDYGAYQNRLESAYRNNQNKAENTTAAESRIRDTDMAAMMMKLSKENILAQAGEAMMAQANQSKQGVLNLLS